MHESQNERSVFLERQIVRRKRNWQKRLKQAERALLSVAIMIAGLVCLYVLYQMIFLGSIFSVKKIVVEGQFHNLSSEKLTELSEVKEGDNLFWVNAKEVHNRLLSNSWVARAAVTRRLPDTLWIYVEEYKPAALISEKDGLFFVNEDSTVFKRADSGDKCDLPIFTGVEENENDPNSAAAAEKISHMISVLKLFGDSQMGKDMEVSEVNYQRDKGYSLVIKRAKEVEGSPTVSVEGPLQIFLGYTAMKESLDGVDLMLQAVSKHPGRIQYILANEKERIVVKFQSS